MRALMLLISLLAIGSAAAPVLVDDFSRRINPGYWGTYDWGGPAVFHERGKVVCWIPSNSEGASFVAGLEGRTIARGDFDVKVDYALPEWPGSSGVRIGLSANSLDRQTVVNVERIGFGVGENPKGPSEVYLTHFFDGISGITPTEDRSGRLRLVRVGSVFSGYCWNSAKEGWVLLDSGPGPAGDIFFGLSAWSHDHVFGDEDAQVTFDNYRLEADEVLLPVKPVGLQAPMAALAPEGEVPPLPRRTFVAGRTIPLKLKLLIRGKPVTDEDVSPPEIVALFRGGVALDLSNLDLDGGKPGHDLHFHSSGKKWTYSLSTTGLSAGSYAIVLRMPDDARYSARFVLRERRR